MAEGKPILRVGKIKRMGRSTPASVMAHLARTRPTPNANQHKTIQNRWLVGDAYLDLGERIEEVMHSVGIDPTKLRKDAVLANDILLTVSPEWFRPDAPEKHGTWDDNRLKTFQAEAEQMLRETFGKRLVAAVLHLDEATPHVQAVVVPIMRKKDDAPGWRLSAKDMFNPKSLGSLQDRWEARMEPHGVGKRVKGSRARHTTLREYYGVLEETREWDPRPKISLSDPPQKKFLENSESHQERLKQWKNAERKRLREELRPLAVQASQGRLYDAERRAYDQILGKVEIQREKLQKAYERIKSDKAEIERLRRTPINSVAAALGWTEPLKPRENAIDLTMRAGQLSYSDALGWLAQRFGADTAATAAREYVELAAKQLEKERESRPILTKAERVKQDALKRQFEALGAPAYRITVMEHREGKKVAQNLGKRGRGQPEKLFTAQEVREMIPRLTAINARGGNIFITPLDEAVHHVLLDDLSEAGLKKLKAEGYSPALVQETSPGSIQALFKIPQEGTDKSAVNEWFKDLNRTYGDPKITGLTHPLRLAGFQNMKPKHEGADGGRRPFVRLLEHTGQLCRKALAVVLAYPQQQRLEQQRRIESEKNRQAEPAPGESSIGGPTLG